MLECWLYGLDKFYHKTKEPWSPCLCNGRDDNGTCIIRLWASLTGLNYLTHLKDLPPTVTPASLPGLLSHCSCLVALRLQKADHLLSQICAPVLPPFCISVYCSVKKNSPCPQGSKTMCDRHHIYQTVS